MKPTSRASSSSPASTKSQNPAALPSTHSNLSKHLLESRQFPSTTKMAKLSTRLTRFFKPTQRSHSASPSLKSIISNPILPPQDDTHPLLTHSNPPSISTLSNTDTHPLEQTPLHDSLSEDIDEIILSYSSPAFADTQPYNTLSEATWRTANTRPDLKQGDASPTPSSVYSIFPSPSPSPSASPSPSNEVNSSESPARVKARLERFRDTPPPAPGWEKVCFGGEVGEGMGRTRRRRDWRGEGARRGYVVL